MATTYNYIGTTAMAKYDELIKNYIDTADAQSIKGIGVDGHTLQFYTELPIDAEGVTPAYTVELPDTDTSDLMELVEGATENNIAILDADGQVIDSGKALSDFVQSITTGETDGTISVDGTEVAIAGLGSAAYTDSSAYDAAGTAETLVDAAKEELEGEIGDLEDLNTTSKSDLVSAINETFTAIGTGGTNAVVTITTDETTEGYAKTYTVSQGGTTIGTIDIPKDMVVSSGTVVVDPDGMDEGTYIALTIANDDGDTIYINVADLVSIYTAQEDAAQVQLSISADNVISATIVAGSVGTTELADGAVTTAKIADGNVTTEKLSTTVQESLEKADSAVQSIESGTEDGTISVDGTDVAVTGLGSAAYTDADAYDEAGAADAALEEAKAYTDSVAFDGVFEEISEEEIEALFE